MTEGCKQVLLIDWDSGYAKVGKNMYRTCYGEPNLVYYQGNKEVERWSAILKVTVVVGRVTTMEKVAALRSEEEGLKRKSG